MAKITPSIVVRIIDQHFPWSREGDIHATRRIDFSTGSVIVAVLALVDRIPSELISTAGDDYPMVVFATSDLKQTIQDAPEFRNRSGGSNPILGRWPVYGNKDSMQILRNVLATCAGESPAGATHGLDFLKPEAVRNLIRNDLGATESAYQNGEWKAATVLGGSVLEALIFWAIQQRWDSANPLPCSPKNNPDPKEWKASILINVAAQSGLIKQDTYQYSTLAKDARDLIHPARVLKQGYACDQGTAMGALAAVYSVIRDLTAISAGGAVCAPGPR